MFRKYCKTTKSIILRCWIKVFAFGWLGLLLINYKLFAKHSSSNLLSLSMKFEEMDTCKTNLQCQGKESGISHSVSMKAESFESIWNKHHDVKIGGSWKQDNCISNTRIALIIPYRDRETHLQLFIKNIIPFLKAQNKSFTIFVVEQTGPEIFNKAQLMNAGFIESQKLGNYSCFIFHDVDMVPVNLCNIYECPTDGMRHLGISRDIKNPEIVYKRCIGGASAFTKDIFHRINGFTNIMFGWGGEDDNAYYRLLKVGIKIHRHNATIGNYMGLPHVKHDNSNPKSNRSGDFSHQHDRYIKYDGLNTVSYNLTNITKHQLFTKITISMTGPRQASVLMRYFMLKTSKFELKFSHEHSGVRPNKTGIPGAFMIYR